MISQSFNALLMRFSEKLDDFFTLQPLYRVSMFFFSPGQFIKRASYMFFFVLSITATSLVNEIRLLSMSGESDIHYSCAQNFFCDQSSSKSLALIILRRQLFARLQMALDTFRNQLYTLINDLSY